MNKLAKRLVLAATLGVGAYLLAGYLLGPALIDRALRSYGERHPQRAVSVDRITVNPVTLGVDLGGIEITEMGAARVAAEHVVLNFGASSLLRSGYVLDSLEIEQALIAAPSMPSLRLDSLDALADLLDVDTSDWPTFRLASLRLSDTSVRGTDGAIVLEDIELAAADLQRTDDGFQAASFDLGFRDGRGTAFAASGALSTAPFALRGRFTLEGFDLSRIDARPPLGATSGEARLGGDFIVPGRRGERSVAIDRGRAEIFALTARYGADIDISARRVAAAFSADVGPTDDVTPLTGTIELKAEAIAVDDRTAAGASTLDVGRLETELEFEYANAQPSLAGGFALDAVRLTRPGASSPVLLADLIGADGVSIDSSAGVIEVDTARAEAPTTEIDLSRPALPLPDWLTRRRVSLRHMEITGGRVDFVDARPSPAVTFETRALAGTIDGLGGEATHAVIELDGLLTSSPDDGRIALSWRRPRTGTDAAAQLTVSLQGLDAVMLAPYAAAWTSSGITGGKLDLLARYELRGGNLIGSSDWEVRGLTLEPVTAPPRRQPPAWVSPVRLPLEFAVALHADPAARINLSLPLRARVATTEPYLPGVLGAALRQHIEASAAAPFAALAGLVARDADALSGVPFAAGSAEISFAARAALDPLAEALARRPALALIVPGDRTSAADREALAEEQVRIHVALATAEAAQPDPPSELDFSSPRTQAVLDEFAGERLAPNERAALAARFDAESAAEPAARAPYYAAVFQALAANEEIAPAALRRLARFRAQAIAAELESLGVEATRLVIADAGGADSGASRGPAVRVPLKLGLADGHSSRI